MAPVNLAQDRNMLQSGDFVPHFVVRTMAGDVISYRDAIWQRRILVLVSLAGTTTSYRNAYIQGAAALESEFARIGASCVVTADPVDGLPHPAGLVADEWGEIVCIGMRTDRSELPLPEELLSWAIHVRQRCPECEGEAK
jgi:hypothetical protein